MRKMGRKKQAERKNILGSQNLDRKKAFGIFLLAVGMLLGGCSLAVPQAGAEGGGDRLIGAYITLDDLELYDMDAFFQDHSGQFADGKQFHAADMSGYKQKLYASIDKCGSQSPSDWEVSFPGVEGICFFAPKWTDENGESVEAGMYDDRICERHFACNVTDTGEETSMDGKIYVAGAYGDFKYQLNPVYQTAEGDIYLTAGPSSSAKLDGEALEGGESGLSVSYETKQTETDGKVQTNTKTEKITVSIKLAVMHKPVEITLWQMDAGHKVLKKERFLPKDLPQKLYAQEETAYILAETEKESPSGETYISRAVCENRKEGEAVLESYCEAGNGVVLKKDIEVEWR